MKKILPIFLCVISLVIGADGSNILTNPDAKATLRSLNQHDIDLLPAPYNRILHVGNKVAILGGARESGLRQLTPNIYAINDNVVNVPIRLTGDIVGNFLRPADFSNLAEAFDIVFIENPGPENVYKKEMYETAILLAKPKGRIVVTGYYGDEKIRRIGKAKFKAIYDKNESNKAFTPKEKTTILFNLYYESVVFKYILTRQMQLPLVPVLLPELTKETQIAGIDALRYHKLKPNIQAATTLYDQGFRLYDCWDKNITGILFTGAHNHWYCVFKKKSAITKPEATATTTSSTSTTTSSSSTVTTSSSSSSSPPRTASPKGSPRGSSKGSSTTSSAGIYDF